MREKAHPAGFERLRSVATSVAVLAMVSTFGLFVFGIGMRYLFDAPQRWVDEAVTILATWLVFWTGAFVLRWPEFISFDVVYRLVPPAAQRVMVLGGSLGCVAAFGAVIWGVTDYIMFMKIMTTDMMRLRLDIVYSIFVVFLATMILRLLFLAARLAFGDWRRVLADLDGSPEVAE